MAWWQRKPKRKVPAPVSPPQHGTKNPLFHSNEPLTAFRWHVVYITLGCLLLLVAAFALYGPWFHITTVEIRGTHDLNPKSVQSVTQAYLQSWQWGIIPHRNSWLLSRRNLAQHLEEKIRQRLSIEKVEIAKHGRHTLQITITERTPLAVWSNQTKTAVMDRHGVIITLTTANSILPVIIDQGTNPFDIGQHVVTETVAKSIMTLWQEVQRVHLPLENFIIPAPHCPLAIVDPSTNVNTNSATNENTNAPRNTNEDINTNAEASEGPRAVPTDCDLAALTKNSQEIHLKIKDGPLVLFDRHQNLPLAVTTLTRLLADKKNAGATYIDIRFQERVYIK